MKKDADIRVRLSVEEKALIEAAARRSGLSVSSWLRQMALPAARHSAEFAKVEGMLARAAQQAWEQKMSEGKGDSE
jgi:uncharacterized protein (DUF1778 family)